MAYFVPRQVSNEPVEVTARYSEIEPLRANTSGLVYFAEDRIRQQRVMVKKLARPFTTESIAKHTFKEITMLKHLKHENIVNLVDIFISPSEDIYLITDLMETNLKTMLDSRSIGNEFVQYFLYQIMRGLKYAHSAGVIHQALEPSKILVNRNCDLKICDFGLVQAQKPWPTACGSATYYSAPEILLSRQSYNTQIDIWSAGCVLAELLLGKPLFPGENSIHQLHTITKLLGSPSGDILSEKTTENPPNLSIQSFPKSEGKAMSAVFPGVDPLAIDFLKKIIVFDPCIRATASEALTFPYLAPYHDPADEPEAENILDRKSLEIDHSISVWKAKVFAEVQHYHEEAMLQESVRSWLQMQPMTMA